MKYSLLFITIIATLSSSSQKILSPVQIAERNKPGTVMIQATFKGTVSAIKPEFDEAALRALALEVKEGLEEEDMFTKDLFWNLYIKAFCANVSKYMMKGRETVSKELNTTMMGSGFIITPDGYVITNAHVVDENSETMKQRFAQQAFQEIIEDDAKEMENTMGRKLSDDEAKALTDANSWYFSQTLTVGNIKKDFSVVMGISGDKNEIIPLVIPAKIVTQGAAIPGKDVAILKLTKKHVYPTIRIGDDKGMRVGDQVYALGYPAVATFHPLISEKSVSEATLTRGLVSAKKNMKDGWEVLQTDASITHGNSGGPVSNEKGEVIGLATFGSIDEQRGQEVQGMNFIVPVTIVQEFIEKAEVKPEMSDISLAYENALDYFDKAWYKKALAKFKEVKGMNNSFPFVDQFIEETAKNIEKGLDKEPTGLDPLYYYIGGGALLVVLVLVLLWRKKR